MYNNKENISIELDSSFQELCDLSYMDEDFLSEHIIRYIEVKQKMPIRKVDMEDGFYNIGQYLYDGKIDPAVMLLDIGVSYSGKKEDALKRCNLIDADWDEDEDEDEEVEYYDPQKSGDTIRPLTELFHSQAFKDQLG